MARLTQEPYQLPQRDDFDDFQTYMEAEKEALNSLEDPIIRFPRADGFALYRVVEWEHVESCECCGRGGEPLLQHIPYGDAWHADSNTIRGLTTESARDRAETEVSA